MGNTVFNALTKILEDGPQPIKAPVSRVLNRGRSLREAWIDRRLGIDTIPNHPEVKRGDSRGYMPAPWGTLSAILEPNECGGTFVDVGCGKGRILIEALALGFDRVIGIEYDPELCRVARANVGRAEIIVEDALKAPLPTGSFVAALFNPFERETFRRFATRLNGSGALVAYLNPKEAGTLKELDFTLIREGRHSTLRWQLYRSP